jgi:hypothetical protein
MAGAEVDVGPADEVDRRGAALGRDVGVAVRLADAPWAVPDGDGQPALDMVFPAAHLGVVGGVLLYAGMLAMFYVTFRLLRRSRPAVPNPVAA